MRTFLKNSKGETFVEPIGATGFLIGLAQIVFIICFFFGANDGHANPMFRGHQGAISYSPDSETSLIFRAVADDNAGADGSNVDPWTPHNSFATLTNTPWAFGTKPVLKANIMNGHKVVRFDGVDNQNNMATAITINSTPLTVVVCGVKRGSKNQAGFLTIQDGSTDDYDSTAESSFYEGTGGIEFLAAYRNNGRLALALHPGTTIPFVYFCTWDGTNNVGYLGDWPSLAVASTGAFNSSAFGVGARHTAGGYNNNSQIDVADVMLFNATSTTVRRLVLSYLQNAYNVATPVIFLINGDSITQPGNWDGTLRTDWNGTKYNFENQSVGGATITNGTAGNDVWTHWNAADIWNRQGQRFTPSKTIFWLAEYVNEPPLAGHSLGDAEDNTNFFNLNKALADKAHALGSLVMVTDDWHDHTSVSGKNMEGRRAYMLAHYTDVDNSVGTWPMADYILRLDTVTVGGISLQARSNANSDGTHLDATGYAAYPAPIEAAVSAMLP